MSEEPTLLQKFEQVCFNEGNIKCEMDFISKEFHRLNTIYNDILKHKKELLEKLSNSEPSSEP